LSGVEVSNAIAFLIQGRVDKLIVAATACQGVIAIATD